MCHPKYNRHHAIYKKEMEEMVESDGSRLGRKTESKDETMRWRREAGRGRTNHGGRQEATKRGSERHERSGGTRLHRGRYGRKRAGRVLRNTFLGFPRSSRTSLLPWNPPPEPTSSPFL